MLVKIKVGDKTLEFDSQKHLIAILLDDGSRASIAQMKDDERLVLSGPLHEIQHGSAAAWQWAMTDWKGAKFVPAQLLGANGAIAKGS